MSCIKLGKPLLQFTCSPGAHHAGAAKEMTKGQKVGRMLAKLLRVVFERGSNINKGANKLGWLIRVEFRFVLFGNANCRKPVFCLLDTAEDSS